MGLLFGIVDFSGRPIARERVEAARSRVARFTPDRFGSDSGDGWHFGQSDFFSSPESRFEKMPLQDPDSGTALVAAARLDNRQELLEGLAVPDVDRPTTPDGRLVFLAWRKWGEEAPRHLRGDWSFAAWNARMRRLCVARDQIGNTGLFYTFQDGRFAFSSIAALIFDLTGAPRRLNEAKLAQHLVIYPGNPGATIWQDVHALGPASQLQVTGDGPHQKNYWSLEEVRPRRLSGESEYQEAFRGAFRAAVRRRMRGSGATATQLSCGLDSSAVTAFAAEFAHESNDRIFSFTSVPVHPAGHLHPGSITDEWSLAHLVAERFPSITHIPIAAREVSPIRVLHRSVDTLQMPMHAATNAYWIHALRGEAVKLGVKTMLTGQLGNGGISWSGGSNLIFHLFLAGRWKAAFRALGENRRFQGIGWLRAVRRHILGPLLKPWLARARHAWEGAGCPWRSYAAIRPEFAQRVGVAERIRESGHDALFSTPPSPAVERHRTLMVNAALAGLIHHQENAVFPLQYLDPTVDLDLLELCLGVPETLFTAGGGSRMFLRRSMEGILPPEVQWNQVRGKQGADLAFRLIDAAADVEEELARLSRSSAVEAYLSVPAMTKAWKRIQDRGTKFPDDGAIPLLMRGIQTGIFLERFFG